MIFIPWLFLMLGCQAPVPGTADLVLDFQFPSSVKSVRRYRHLIERTRYLRLALSSSDGWSSEAQYPPGEWKRVPISRIPFPRQEHDSLTVTASLWDKKADGTPRAYAALSGKATLKAEAVNHDGPTEIPIRLTLKVAPTEFD